VTTKKKLQIFISSTYTDLRGERQAAVEAVLTAGHIPAGMELFAAGDEAQMKVIKRWIDESDVYMLILGGRYGSIEPKTQKSYIQLEYEYAVDKGKPLFAVVIDENYLEKKVKKYGSSVIEKDYPDKLRRFRELVCSKMVRFWSDPKDIKLFIMETIADFSKRAELVGWIPGGERLITEIVGQGEASLFESTSIRQNSFEFSEFPPDVAIQILQERLLIRTIEQLDPSVRRYQRMRAVEDGCKALVSRIKTDNFMPDMVIGWRDRNRDYRGSETVANLLAQELALPLHVILMQEIRERRQVIEECQWFKGANKALIVDDACYSGSTLRSIQGTLASINTQAEIRFAVLTTIDANKLPNLYHVSIHSTEELLFPWGWSRLIVGLYDIYQAFRIPDRHTIWSEDTQWGSIDTLVRNFTGNVRLLTIEPKMEIWEYARREFDTFLYFLSGSVDVHIGNESGTFNKNEYLFIPRFVGYSISAHDNAKILELLSGSA
jgi:hypoxanthine phosphoribosyltransferase/mannose-6-phosphate isomerase-like protein (cupin superfamily)